MTYREFLSEWIDPTKDYIEAHSSGSTGTPKTICLNKRLVASSARRTVDFFGINSRSWLHSCISPDFIGGKMMLVRAMSAKCAFSYETPSNRPSLTRGEGIFHINFSDSNPDLRFPDIVSVVPSQMQYILENYTEIPDNVNFIVGGQAIHPLLRKNIEASGVNAWESYGMTETASHIALRRIKEMPDAFRPLPGIDVSRDSRECLVIDLPFSEKIITNDLCDINSDGAFSIRGRADNVIISGGKKISPEKVESILSPLLSELGITDIILTSTPDVKWGEALTLLMETNIDAQPSEDTLKKVESIARNNLDNHEIPKIYKFISQLPRTPNGKPIRFPNKSNFTPNKPES